MSAELSICSQKILTLLRESGDELSRRRIAERLGYAYGSVSLHLGHLVRLGLVSVRRDEDDRRRLLYSADSSALETALRFEPLEGLTGLRQEWITGERKDATFGFDVGAGLGNPLLTFWVERGGKRRYYACDMSSVLQRLAGQFPVDEDGT